MKPTRLYNYAGIRWALLLLAFMSTATMAQQRTSVQATVQPAEIMIGEQALINLKVITPKGTTVLFPVFEKDIVEGLEVITMLPPDTLIENEVATMDFRYVVTSFDSTLYHIPHMSVFDGTDTIFSNSFGLKVTSPVLKDSTVAYLEKLNTGQTDTIDFEQLQLHDIKALQKPPFVWTDYLWVLWILLATAVVALLIVFVVLMLMRKKDKGYFFTPPVVLKPHERALLALDKVKEQKLAHSGREKEYYTTLTDIVRRYIFERFDINAMEMTSNETLEAIGEEEVTQPVSGELRQILEVADLVKFAKHTPLLNENDLSLQNAYRFVTETKLIEEVEGDESAESVKDAKGKAQANKQSANKGTADSTETSSNQQA